jgi:two-component system, cell cycle response regulator
VKTLARRPTANPQVNHKHDLVKSLAWAMQTPRLWRAYLLGGAVAGFGCMTLPASSAAHKALFILIVASSVAALVTGILVHEPGARSGWLLLAAAQLLRTIGDAIASVKPAALWVDACYLAMYVLLTAALLVFVRRRTPGWDVATLVDAAVLAISSGVVWWLYLIVPLTRDGGADPLTIAVPAMDLLVVVVALRLVLGTGARTAAYRLLAVSLVLMLCADVVVALRSAVGGETTSGWADLLWLAAYVTLGAAALHPSMRWLDNRARHRTPEVGPLRLGLLVTGALVPVLMLGSDRNDDHVAVIVACTTAMFLLVVGRLLSLAGTERQAAIVDPLTGLYADGVFEATLALAGDRATSTGTSLAMVMIDVDNLTALAQAYGEPAADRVLCELADRIRARCRPGDLVARVGPCRFSILLPGVDGYDAARFAAVLRVLVCERRVRIEPGTALRVTATVGVGSLPADAHAPRHLLRVVARAVDTASAAGGNRTHTPTGSVTVAADRL